MYGRTGAVNEFVRRRRWRRRSAAKAGIRLESFIHALPPFSGAHWPRRRRRRRWRRARWHWRRRRRERSTVSGTAAMRPIPMPAAARHRFESPSECAFSCSSQLPLFTHSTGAAVAHASRPRAMDDAWSLFGDDTTAPSAPPPPIAAAAAAVTGAAAVDAALAVFAEITVPTPQPREHGEGSSSLWPAQPARFMGPITPARSTAWAAASSPRATSSRASCSSSRRRCCAGRRRSATRRRCSALASSSPAEQAAALAALALLHPVAPLEATARARAEAAHGRTADELAPLWKGAECSRDELLRLCPVVQWNGFASGLFLHQSIFNHACPQFANCDRGRRGRRRRARRRGGGGGGRRAALGRARDRPIARGEQCCISYVQPPGSSPPSAPSASASLILGARAPASRPSTRWRRPAAASGGAPTPTTRPAPGDQGAAREVDAALGAPPEATEPLVRAALRPLRRACAGPRHPRSPPRTAASSPRWGRRGGCARRRRRAPRCARVRGRAVGDAARAARPAPPRRCRDAAPRRRPPPAPARERAAAPLRALPRLGHRRRRRARRAEGDAAPRGDRAALRQWAGGEGGTVGWPWWVIE